MDVSYYPCEGAETVSSTMGLRPLGGIISLAVATNLPLEVVLSSVIGYFFGGIAHLRGLLRRDLVGEKSECWDSDLNESIKI